MKLSRLVGSLLCSLVFSSVVVSAQSISVSGDIRGTITDPSGAVLPKVSVATLDPQTGFQRTAVTDATGQFRLTGLPPAAYDLTATASGFTTGVRKRLDVAVGQTTVCDVQLRVSSTAVQIEVTDLPALVEPERGGQANSVSEHYICLLYTSDAADE